MALMLPTVGAFAAISQGISGTVVTEAGGISVPVVGAAVTVWTTAATPAEVASATTDGAGNYEVALPVGNYYVQFDAAGFATQYYDASADLNGATAVSVVQDEVAFVEIFGPIRYTTAVEISKKAYPEGADYVVIATGENWPDALGGSSLAGVLDGPILLTQPEVLPAAVLAEIQRLGATKAVILGGTGAVSPAVEASLNSELGELNVTRIGGIDRYATARMVAAETVRLQNGAGGYDGIAFVATGDEFPDALSASPLAAANGWPIFLIRPTAGVSSATIAGMQSAGVTEALILGGTGVVSAGDEAIIAASVPCTTDRLFGDTRYETALAVAEYGVAHAGLGWDMLAIATGRDFPDALAGGVLQAKSGSVMLLTAPTTLHSTVSSAITTHRAALSEVRVLGGTGPVNEDVRDEIRALLLPIGTVTTGIDATLVDNVVPVITITEVADGALYNHAVTPSIVVDDGTATVVATLNGAPYIPGTPITADGTYTLVVTATDPAGNESTETITFTIDATGPVITITGVNDTIAGPLAGTVAAGFTLPTTNNPAIDHELSLAAGSVSSEALADAYNGLTLVPEAGQTAALLAYYTARGVPEPYLAYLSAAAAGTQPFVYLKADGTTLSLVDAAKYFVSGTDNPMAIPDDFPLGTYTVTGTVADADGNTTDVTFTLIVE